ncbi:hypothetical protein [Salarchaeum japonicum]|uniref:hypothetical protein n=1 Tax=Salarchaeum japonicum TaxID=555573 RepID=UPI003C75EE00
MTFPAEHVPDGAVFAPHHLTWGVLVVVFAAWIVSDNYPRREPLFAMAGAGLALFAFLFVWRFYPAAGAALALTGVTMTFAGILYPGGVWAAYPLRWRVLAFVGAVVALDDAVSHAFGVWTPVDAAWRAFLIPVIA